RDSRSIHLFLDQARPDDHVAVARDGPRDPVDVGRIENLDLAQRVAVEFAEVQYRLARLLERGHANAALAAPVLDRSCRCACPEIGLLRSAPRPRNVATQRARLAQPRVSRSERCRRVEARRDRRCPRRWRWTTRPAIGSEVLVELDPITGSTLCS